jgi:glycosyltransferase involved in cell wall biosynthesis
LNNFIIFEDSSKSKFGGGQKVSFELIKILKRNFFNISLIDFTSKSTFCIESNNIVQNSLVLTTFNFQKKSSQNSFTFSKFEIIFNLLFFPFNLYRILNFLKRIPLNSKTILICPTKKTVLYGLIIKLIRPKIFLIFHVHNYLNNHYLWSHFMKGVIKYTDDNWFVSSTVKSSYGQNVKGVIIYNPIELNFKKKVLKSNHEVNIGLVANLLGYKGIKYFINSYDHLQSDISNKIIYHIYGDGPEKKELMSMSNHNSNIVFHGFLSQNKVYDQIDLLVCPSIQEEAFSLVIFEATQNSIPVIATNLKVHKEFFSNNSLLFVNVKSEFEIANAITDILNDENLRLNLVYNAQNDLLTKFNISFESKILNICKSYF